MDGPLVRLQQPLRGRKTETGPACFGREERAEDFLADVGRNSRTRVDKYDLATLVSRVNPYADPATAAHRLGAVHDQVLKDDFQQLGIRTNRRG